MDNNSFAEVCNNFFIALEKYTQVYQKISNLQTIHKPKVPIKFNDLLMKFISRLWSRPEKLLEIQSAIFQEHVNITQNVIDKFLGKDKSTIYLADQKDRRFADEIWENNALYSYLKQTYFMISSYTKNIIKDWDDIEGAEKKRIEFALEQLINAFSPTNFINTNPTVLKETIESKGANLVKGLDNLLADLENTNNIFNISTTPNGHFELGENIATTKGKVIYQNEMMQLIHYEPLLNNNYAVPLLIVPPWINKYYILDLKESNSFVRWLLSQGYSLFIISWINPDEKHANKNFEDYMLDGTLAAINIIKEHLEVSQVNTIGYCIGGTLLSCTAAYLAAKNDQSIKSATFLTTLIDFEDSGELSLFMTEEQINTIEEHMKEKGFLEGKEMALAFSLMRSNEMIWSFYINNYLLGKEPFPFDLLYWNSDSARLPAKMHSYYLRNMYKDNLLCKPGSLTLGGEKIDISAINIPCYFLSTIEDHIAPWKSTYKNTQLVSGDVKFVLSGSGHVAGVINHPTKNKYGYWINPNYDSDPEKWLEGSCKNEGSWWEDWHKWQEGHSGEKDTPKREGKLDSLEEAPGSYVRVRC